MSSHPLRGYSLADLRTRSDSFGLMGLAQTKREYIDRDISPEMLTLIRLAEALSPKVICALLIVGLVATSQSILTFCRWVRTLLRPTPAGRTRLPTITWPLPELATRRRASDPGPNAPDIPSLRPVTATSPSPLEGLGQLLRQGLRNRGGLWARFQWR